MRGAPIKCRRCKRPLQPGEAVRAHQGPGYVHRDPCGDPAPDAEWATLSKVLHRLPKLDSPHPDGWLPSELADEYEVTEATMRNVLSTLAKDGRAREEAGRYTAR